MTEADTGFSKKGGGVGCRGYVYFILGHLEAGHAVSGQKAGRQNAGGQYAGQTCKRGQNAGHILGQKFILLMVK